MKLGFYIPLLGLYLFSLNAVFGQTKNLAYQLRGVVNQDTGTVTLLPVSGPDYDPNLTNNYQAKIKRGHFLLEGQMAYPGSYLLRISPNYISGDFLIEPGSQTITCNVDSLRETPQLTTLTMAEYQRFAREYIRPIDKQRAQLFQQYLDKKSATNDSRALDSLQTTFGQNRAQLIHQQHLGYLAYIQQHPRSYVALWQLVKEIKNGYQPVFDSLYNAFATPLKNTRTGQTITQRLHSSKITAIGQVFPSLILLNINSQMTAIPIKSSAKYTLVDFWFSHCGPCIQEFPKLRELFTTYQIKGLNIIGISIDKPADKRIWQETVQQKSLIWPQYLDPSGKFTVGQLSINYFPSNFLLDEKGVIIRKDISPSDLSNFLSERL